MGIMPNPRTWGVGGPPDFKDRPDYSIWNTELRDNIEFLLNPPMCKLRQTAVQGFTSGVWTPITWDFDEVDTDNMHSTTVVPMRVIPKTPGYYIGYGGFSWKNQTSAVDTTGRRLIAARKNGILYLTRMDGRAAGTTNIDRHIKAVPFVGSFNGTTDYVEIIAFQDSGSTINSEANTDPNLQEFWPEMYMRWYRGL